MTKKLFTILILTVILCSGCSKLSRNDILKKGQEKLESHQYDIALTLLSEVLDEDSTNESARAMYMQARKMQSAQEYEKNHEYDKSIKELNSIVNINNGSKKIKQQSINKKIELEKLQEISEKEALERRENAKKTSKEYSNKIESQIIYEMKKSKEKEENIEDESSQESNEDTKENIETIDNQLNDKNMEEFDE